MVQDLSGHRGQVSLRRWARWERFGCPTTANAAKSIHGILNGILTRTQEKSFYNRLTILQEFLWKRVNERNSDERKRKRSVNRYHDMMSKPGFPSGGYRTEPVKSRFEFYRALHSIDVLGRHWIAREWVYPDILKPTDQPLGLEEEAVGDPLPPKWRPQSQRAPKEKEREDAPPANSEADTPDDCLALPNGLEAAPRDAADRRVGHQKNARYNSVGWNLVHSIRRLLYRAHWTEDECEEAITHVFRIGGPYYPGDDREIPVEAEGQWRLAVLKYFHMTDLV
jgi:hypothetical protein